MVKYEYQIKRLPRRLEGEYGPITGLDPLGQYQLPIEFLNTEGADGWELVSKEDRLYYFKRVIT